MSRFNSKAYDQLYPRVEDPAPAPESSVENFPRESKSVEDIKLDPEEPKQDTVKDDPLPEIKDDHVEDPLLDPDEKKEGGKTE